MPEPTNARARFVTPSPIRGPTTAISAGEHGARRHRHADGLLRRRRLRRHDGLRPLAHARARSSRSGRCSPPRARGPPRHPHARGPPAGPRRPAREQALALAPHRRRHRRSRAVRPHPRARRAGLGDHPRAGAAAGRDRHRQAGQGLVLRDRPRADPAHARHPEPRPHRHHHRRVRAHDHARGQRPRLRVPAARGLHRRHRPRQPPGRDQDGHDAGRRVRRRRALHRPVPVVAALA